MRKVRSVIPNLNPAYKVNNHIDIKHTHRQNDLEQNPQLRWCNDWYFFSQSDLEVPEKVVTKHAGQDVVVPAGKFSHLVLVHAEFGLGYIPDNFK
jgi:hypothetical protein